VKKLAHTIKVGRLEVTGQYEGVPIAHGGSLSMRSEELERLELQAAIAVSSQPDLVNGDELRFARKAMDQLQPALAERLDVSVGTFSRWETGAEPIGRQTQLAVLLLLAQTLATGNANAERSIKRHLGASAHRSRPLAFACALEC
jgi:DNA-binding transcriptional regulator YiaG